MATLCVSGTGSASPMPYETHSELEAASLLDTTLLESTRYRIDNIVSNDGRMNRYTLNSEIQSLDVVSNSLLRERAHEIEAIVALRQMKESGAFKRGFQSAAEAPLNLTRNLVTDPVGTIESIPAGLGNLLSDVGAAIAGIGKDSNDKEGSVAKDLIGFNKVKRRLADELGVDPYSSNALLQEELNDVAWSVFAGGAPIEAVMVAAPMVASLSVRISEGAESDPNGWKVNPSTLLQAADQAARASGLSEEESVRLVYHPVCSVNHLTRLVAAVAALDGAPGRGDLLRHSSAADSEQACRHNRELARMIYNYHRDRQNVTALEYREGRLQFRDWDGTRIYPVVADYLTWSEGNAGLIETLSGASGERPTLLLSGRASPALHTLLESRGVTIIEVGLQGSALHAAEILLPERMQALRDGEQKSNRTGEIASSIGDAIGGVVDAITPSSGSDKQ